MLFIPKEMKEYNCLSTQMLAHTNIVSRTQSDSSNNNNNIEHNNNNDCTKKNNNTRKTVIQLEEKGALSLGLCTERKQQKQKSIQRKRERKRNSERKKKLNCT